MRTPSRLVQAVERVIEELEQRRLLAAWLPDPVFGTDGLAAFTGVAPNPAIELVAPLPGGKILAVGQANYPDDAMGMVAHLNADGSLDTSFGGGDGVAIGFSVADVTAAQVQSDGRILIGGTLLNDQMFVGRFNADGTIDSSFGTNGLTVIAFPEQTNWARSELHDLALAPGGKIVITGSIQSAQNTSGEVDRSDLGTARLNANGTLDTTYGNNGTGLHSIAGWDVGRTVVVQPDGKIVVGGSALGPSEDSALLLRYLDNGQGDTSFGDNGIIRMDFDSTVPGNQISEVLLLPDGKMVIGAGIPGAWGLIRKLHSNGETDEDFNGGGTYGIDNRNGSPAGLTLDSQGRIIAVYGGFDDEYFKILRLLPTGLHDETLAPLANVRLIGDRPLSIATDASDRILVGQTGFVLRMSPRPDVAISSTGKLFVTGGDGNDVITIDRSGGNARVVRNGVTTSYPVAQVTSIDLMTEAGNDSTNIALDVPLKADLGAGADSLTVAATTARAANSHDQHNIVGGDGNDLITVGDGIRASITGGSGNDTLSAGAATLQGEEGDDVLTVNGGRADGGTDNDSITGGSAADLLIGEHGDDTLVGGGGVDSIHMGVGSDSVLAGDGDDVVDNGTFENDVAVMNYEKGDREFVDLGAGSHQTMIWSDGVTLIGGDGPDTLIAGIDDGPVEIFGGGGADDLTAYGPATIHGGAGDDFIHATYAGVFNGDAGDDVITTQQGGEVDGGAGNDVITCSGHVSVIVHGGDGHDWIRNLIAPSSIYGGAGYDTLYGGNLSDLISGGGGKDRIDGGRGNDRIYGGANNDQLKGGRGNDRIYGHVGDDKLFGFNGNDMLDGGPGSDFFYGGKGADMLYAADGENDFLDGGKDDDAAEMDDADGMVSVLTVMP